MEKVRMDIGEAAELFKIMSDRSRLAMIAMMNKGECCVCDFTECFEMSQPAVSQHLRKLRGMGLIKERREGYWTHLSLNEESPFYAVIPELLDMMPGIDEYVSKMASCNRRRC